MSKDKEISAGLDKFVSRYEEIFRDYSLSKGDFTWNLIELADSAPALIKAIESFAARAGSGGPSVELGRLIDRVQVQLHHLMGHATGVTYAVHIVTNTLCDNIGWDEAHRIPNPGIPGNSGNAHGMPGTPHSIGEGGQNAEDDDG